MNKNIEERIRSQSVWTFRECVGLAAEFNLKTRAVIAMVYACGREYLDYEAGEEAEERN